MFVVLVELSVEETRLEEFLDAIATNAAASRADEPGCLTFDVYRDLDRPLDFVFHEVYVDRAAFEVAHREAPHYGRWRAAAARCVVPGTQTNRYLAPPTEGDRP